MTFEKTCKHCTKPFEAKSHLAVWCSKLCRERYRNRNTRNKVKSNKICKLCGGEFLSAQPRQAFCSKKCRLKAIRLKTTFELTPAKFQQMMQKAENCCEICKKPQEGDKALAVDHDHATGEVRGLLCYNCNVGLGYFKDSPFLLNSAIAYVLGYKALGTLTNVQTSNQEKADLAPV